MPGAAPAWVTDLLGRPPAPAAVLHRGREAVYLDVGGRCVGVLAAGAALVPCGVRTSVPALPAAGPEVLVGGRGVRLPGCTVDVVATVSTTVAPMTDDGVRRARARARHLLEESAEWLDRLRWELPDHALPGPSGDRPPSVAGLVGAGPGLTPVGDDVLAGWLVAAAAAGTPGAEHVRRETRRLATRTTLLSATLLECAARGEALPEVRALLDVLGHRDHHRAAPVLARVLSVGRTSGAGLALGCLWALAGTDARCAGDGTDR